MSAIWHVFQIKWSLTLVVAGFSCFAFSDSSSNSLFNMSLADLLDVTISSTSHFDETKMSSATTVVHSSPIQWKQQGARTLGEALSHMPSSIGVQGAGTTQMFAVRGYFDFAADTGIAVRLDGIPMNKIRSGTGLLSANGYDLAALESLELIRGPGSSLHGTDAFHGVLSLQTKSHSNDSEYGKSTSVSSALGSHDYSALSVSSHTAEQGTHQAGTTLSYRKFGDQDLRYPYTEPASGLHKSGERSNEQEILNGVFSYMYTPNQTTEYIGTAYLFKVDANQLPGVGREILGESLQEDKDWSDYSSLTSVLKVGVNHRRSERSSLSAFAYYWRNVDFFSTDLSNTFLGFRLDEDREESHFGFQVLNRHEFRDSSVAYGYDFRSGSLDDFAETLIGKDDSVTNNQRVETGFSDDVHSLFFDGRTSIASSSIDFVYGLRLDKYTSFDLQASPRLSLIGPVGEGSVWKLSYGHAFRAPNLFHLYGASTTKPNFDIQPDQLDNIEVVFQRQVQDYFVSVTAFKNWWSDAIRSVLLDQPEGDFVLQYQNTGKNEAYGAEFEAKFERNRSRADLSLSYIKSRNVDSNDDYAAFPDWILNLGLGYQLSDRLDVYMNNRFHHRQEASESGVSQGSRQFFRADVIFNWEQTERLTAQFAVRNLFDRNNYLPSYFGHEEGVPDTAINASVSLNFRF